MESINKANKINKSLKHDLFFRKKRIYEFEIYSFKSNSWKILDVTPDLGYRVRSPWYPNEQRQVVSTGEILGFLICFDFTTDKFGPHLPLPFHSSYYLKDIVTLSSVGGVKLVVLFHCEHTPRMEIWATTKIEPKEVSWGRKLFLAVDMEPITGFDFLVDDGSFFID